MVVNLWLSARPATFFILPRHFLEFSVFNGQNLVDDQNLVCAPPGLQSPAGLPAAAYLGVPSASVQAPNALRRRKRA
jgi:hypothetical protein